MGEVVLINWSDIEDGDDAKGRLVTMGNDGPEIDLDLVRRITQADRDEKRRARERGSDTMTSSSTSTLSSRDGGGKKSLGRRRAVPLAELEALRRAEESYDSLDGGAGGSHRKGVPGSSAKSVSIKNGASVAKGKAASGKGKADEGKTAKGKGKAAKGKGEGSNVSGKGKGKGKGKGRRR